MRRRNFLGMLAAPALPGSGPAQQGHAGNTKDRPNFLVLMSDQHSPHVLGCDGDKVVRTPNLDALAADGALFENAYCQSPVCVPSRMSFLTGQQPFEIKVWTNGDTLASDVSTFAHSLGAAGYETTLIGRMHFNGVDQWHGFEKRLVGSLSPIYPHISYPLPPRLLVGARGSSRESVRLAGPGKTAYQVYDAEVTKTTADFLRQKAKESDRPFCIVSGFVLPHCPYICSKEDWDYYLRRVTLPRIPQQFFENLHPAIKTWRKNRQTEYLTEEEILRARAGYYGLVTQFDRQVGLMMDALKATGLDKNTVVIYTTDHGEMAGEHGMWWKSNFYEAAVSVPLIISSPERFKPGRRVKEVVSLTDLGPTMVDLAGSDKMPEASGASLAPLLRAERVDWANEAFSEYAPSAGVPAMRMVRSGKWKLVHYEGLRPQLFDLENDPDEFEDLGNSPGHTEIRNQLHERVLTAWSAEELKKELAKRGRHRGVIRTWAEKVRPDAPLQWTEPEGANVFPLAE